MYRVLLVDDDRFRSDFIDCIRAEIPDADVREAISVPEALSAIEQAAASGDGFDAVILDANLPGADGVLKIDTSLCSLVATKLPGTLVAHCSIHAESDDALKHHIRSVHLDALWGPPYVVVTKGPLGWETELIQGLATHRIKEKVRQYFGGNGGGGPSATFGRGGGTALAGELTAELERFWHLLPDKFRAELLERFWVSPDGKRVRFRTGLEES